MVTFAANLLRRAVFDSSTFLRMALVTSIVVATGIAHPTTSESLLTTWADTQNRTYTHGYLVAAICLWLIVRASIVPLAGRLAPNVAALGVVAGLSLAMVIFQRAGIVIGHQMVLPLLVWTAVLAAGGMPFARLQAFPIGYLYFAIPVWSHINDALQAITIFAVRLFLRGTGVPAYFEGDLVHLASGTFAIADGCSGLHFFIVGLALAALLGEVQKDSIGHRLRHLVFAAALAVVANWVRVYTIILAGQLTDMQHYLVRVDHYTFGWLVFAVAMTLFFIFSRPAASIEGPADMLAGKPAGPFRYWSLAPAIAALVVPPFVSAAMRSTEKLAPSAELSSGSSTWTRSASQHDWRPVFRGTDAESTTAYDTSEGSVQMYVGVYAEQRQGKEFAGYENDVAAGLSVQSSSRAKMAGHVMSEYEAVDAAGSRWLLWSRYYVAGRGFADAAVAQLWYGTASLLDNPSSRAFVLRTECNTADCSAARELLGRFIAVTNFTDAPYGPR